jgi:hypothetical protein
MKRLKGPELKLSELRVPQVVSDLYWDLRDRRLLPLIGLAVVAIVAVPFLLAGKSESPPPVASGGGGLGEATPEAAKLTVVEAKPGLRDYQKRLARRTPTDPFEQQYTAPSTSGAELGSSSSSDSIAGTVSTGPTEGESTLGSTVTSPSTPEQTSSGTGGQTQLPHSHLFGFRPDVRFGVAGSNELTTHEELKVGSFLPKHDPIVIFIGVTQNGARALFDVSPEVSLVHGDSNCVGGDEGCHILSLRKGEAVTFTTEDGRAFRLAVVRIRFVEVHVPSGASSSTWRPVASGLAQNFSN